MISKIKIISSNSPNVGKVVTSDNKIEGDLWKLYGKVANECNTDKGIMYYSPFTWMMPYIDETFQKEDGKWYAETDGEKMVTITKLNGEYEVEIYGCDKPCIGYFWTEEDSSISVKVPGGTFNLPNTKQLGLVCLKSDTESCDYAKQQMKMHMKEIKY